MKRYLLLVPALLVLTGCGEVHIDESTMQVVNQCKRVELFQSCMKALPAGPVSTHYNDWDEVVKSCDQAAYRQSISLLTAVPAECRAR